MVSICLLARLSIYLGKCANNWHWIGVDLAEPWAHAHRTLWKETAPKWWHFAFCTTKTICLIDLMLSMYLDLALLEFFWARFVRFRVKNDCVIEKKFTWFGNVQQLVDDAQNQHRLCLLSSVRLEMPLQNVLSCFFPQWIELQFKLKWTSSYSICKTHKNQQNWNEMKKFFSERLTLYTFVD